MPELTSETRADFDALLEALMPFAEARLRKHGAFYPFGAAVSTTGEVNPHATCDGNEAPSPEEVITGLIQAFKAAARASRIRATGICYDGRIVQDGREVDAVIVDLEHVSGSACTTCVAYSKGLFGTYRFGALIARSGKPRGFWIA